MDYLSTNTNPRTRTNFQLNKKFYFHHTIIFIRNDYSMQARKSSYLMMPQSIFHHTHIENQQIKHSFFLSEKPLFLTKPA